MKTTIEMQDALFRRVKSVSASKGVSLKDFITEALKAKLLQEGAQDSGESRLIGFGDFGSDKGAGKETRAIQKRIDEEFSKIDQAEWK